jgi:hypothetical protein
MRRSARWSGRRIVLLAACALGAGFVLRSDWQAADALLDGILVLAVAAVGLTIACDTVPPPEDDEREIGKLPSKIDQWRKLRYGIKPRR